MALTGKIPPYSAPVAFGRFEVLHQVGAGVLGPVFLARDPERTRSVAVKVFRLDITPEQAAELASQLGMLARANLAHPSIIAPFEAGIEGTVAYLAEDYVAADSLDAAIRQYGPAPISQAIRILAAVAGALDFGAAAGVYHGALHPRDLLVTPDDTRVTGLGIGRALEAVGLRAPMRRPYVAPERVQREGWDARADIYSLGVLARELLAARPKSDASVEPRLPDEPAERLQPVLARATAARPADRFSTCLEFIGAVQDAIAGTPRRAPLPVAAPQPGDQPAPAGQATQSAHDLLLPLEGDEVAGAEERTASGAGRLRLEDGEVAPLPDLDLRAGRRDETASEPFDLSDLDSQLIGKAGGAPDGELPAGQAEERAVPESAAFDRMAGLSIAGPRTAELDQPVGLPLPEDDADRPERFGDVFTAPPEPAPETASDEPAVVTPLPPPERPAVTGRSPRSDPGAREQSRAPLVAAMLIVGLVIGAAAGYFVGARRTQKVVPSEPSTSTQPAPVPGLPGGSTAASPASQPATPPTRPRTGAAVGTPGAAAASALPVAVNGALLVRSTPPGAAVTINGRRARGATPVRIRNLAAGRYTVRVSRRDYAPEERDVVISAERPTSTVSFSLDRTSAAQPASRTGFFGTLSVESLPSGARVFVDGHLIGTTPLADARVAAGSHVLRVDRTGFRPWTTPIQIVTGQRRRETASLERESK